MAKKRRRKAGRDHSLDPDQQTAEFITVGWMLATLATLAAEVVGLVAALVIRVAGPGWSDTIQAFPTLMLAIACISGGMGLVLCVIATRIRQDPAPLVIIRGSILICVLPWLMLLAQSLPGIT